MTRLTTSSPSGAAAGTRDQRAKTFAVASIKIDDVEHRAHVLNISRRGAMMHCAGSPTVGQWVAITCGSHIMSGVVRWRNLYGRFGVQFTIAISTQTLEDIQQR